MCGDCTRTARAGVRVPAAPAPAAAVGAMPAPNLAGRGTCGHLTPVQLSDCPRSPAIRLPNCDQAGLGELCEGDGECDTGNHLNNCPSYTTWYGCMSQGATLTYMI